MQLEKNLTLFDVFAISTGAMFSSGLFLLPGLAAAQTGASVALAYLIAGILMIPAMLSQAELATAMPRAGGTYFFLDRAMGPMLGTIGGLGTWIALIFKSAFALIGMGAYVTLFFEAPIVAIAVGLTLTFAVVNIVGAKETSGLQRALVSVLIVVVVGFVLAGAGNALRGTVTVFMDKPFLIDGIDGLLATVGLVFVSYAGLTKVASVAEEVQNPDRNIPLGMTLSLLVATLAYASAVGVITMVLPAETLHSDLAPMATAAEAIFSGEWRTLGVGLVAVAAVAAFASTANAGILSASRYPLAMARDQLMPSRFARLGRFGTPLWGIVATSLGIILCVVAFDVGMVAKLASAFQLVLFALISLSVIVMRESRLEYYRPGFRSPFYPWLQIIGIVVSLWLIAEMGWIAMAFTAALVAGCVAWHRFYAANRVTRAGAIYHVFERLGRRRFEPLDRELRRVLHDKGLPEGGDAGLFAQTRLLDFHEADFATVVRTVGEEIARDADLEPSALVETFVDELGTGMMPVISGVAFPHHQFVEVNAVHLVVARVHEGVALDVSLNRAHVVVDEPVQVFVFLLSPDGDAARHYRLLAHITSRFEDELRLSELSPSELAQQFFGQNSPAGVAESSEFDAVA